MLAMLGGKMLFFMYMRTHIYLYMLCFLLRQSLVKREHLNKHKLNFPANLVHHV
jgi:hypothetical protein